jgi:ankyrin repeat protein
MRPQIVELLLEAGAAVNCVDEDQRTPLYFAVHSGCAHSVAALLKAGAEPNAVHNIRNAFTHAFGINEDIQKSSVMFSNNWTVHIAASGVSQLQSKHACGKILRMLLQAGADPMALTQSGDSALHVAARGANIEAIEELLSTGLKEEAITQVNHEGKTAYDVALETGNEDLERLIREYLEGLGVYGHF